MRWTVVCYFALCLPLSAGPLSQLFETFSNADDVRRKNIIAELRDKQSPYLNIILVKSIIENEKVQQDDWIRSIRLLEQIPDRSLDTEGKMYRDAFLASGYADISKINIALIKAESVLRNSNIQSANRSFQTTIGLLYCSIPFSQKDYSQAVRNCTFAIERIKGENFKLLHYKAFSQIALGHLSAADSSLTSIIKLVPKPDFYYAIRAEVRENLGKYNEALLDAQYALRLNPNSASYLALSGFIKVKSGLDSEGCKELQRAALREPTDSKIKWYSSEARCPESKQVFYQRNQYEFISIKTVSLTFPRSR